MLVVVVIVILLDRGLYVWPSGKQGGEPLARAWPGPVAAILIHRLPDGVRTNGVFAEVPQYTIIMTYLWHSYGIIMGTYGTFIKKSVCPDPVCCWVPQRVPGRYII